MASIRLFGRGRNAAAAGGPAVSAALIADVLESLAAASMSTTWRCRHQAGASIGEGAVDFSARRSRSTVIRGKYEFEYVRAGASVYRARVEDTDGADGDAGVRGSGAVSAGADGSQSVSADVLESEFEDGDDDIEAEAEEDVEAEGDVEFGDDDEQDAEDEDGDGAEFEGAAFDDDDVDAGDDAGDVGARDDGEPVVSGGGVSSAGSSGMVWETFSDHDACGVHAYAEPAVLAAGVRAAGVVQAREAQEFDGVLLSAYAVTVKPKPGDPNRVLARLARQLRDHGANVVVVTAFADESDVVVGLDGDGGDEPGGEGGSGARIVRLRIELPHWTPADDPTADHSVSVDLFEFGEPVSIAVPGDTVRRKARSCADLGLF